MTSLLLQLLLSRELKATPRESRSPLDSYLGWGLGRAGVLEDATLVKMREVGWRGEGTAPDTGYGLHERQGWG